MKTRARCGRPSPAIVAAVLLGVQLTGWGSAPAWAQLLAVDVSNDIAWTAGASTIDDEGARRVVLPAAIAAIDLGPLPPRADVTAYHELEDGRRIFALDTFVDLGGGATAGPENLVAWNGSAYALYFDGSAAGVPAGAGIDAVATQRTAGVTSTLLSFDVAVALPGGLTVDDEDLAAWTGSVWSLYFDGSANGVPAALDLDGFDRDRVTGARYFSFDTSGRIAAIDFDDEDVVAFDGANWSLAYDASAVLDPTFAAGDLDALGARTVEIFRDGFESGSTIEWSASVPL